MPNTPIVITVSFDSDSATFSWTSKSPHFSTPNGKPQILFASIGLYEITFEPSTGADWSFVSVLFNALTPTDPCYVMPAQVWFVRRTDWGPTIFASKDYGLQVGSLESNKISLLNTNWNESSTGDPIQYAVGLQLQIQSGERYYTSTDPQVINVKNGGTR